MKKLINIQEYIASGILEQYALGLTSAQENLEIQNYLSQYDELRKELGRIEASLESYASTYAQPMPSELKARILHKIKNNSLYTSTPTDKLSVQKFLYVLLTAIGLALIYNFIQYRKNVQELEIIKSKLIAIELQKRQDSLSLVDCNNQLLFIKSKSNSRILLKGTPKSPQSMAMIYYDVNNKRTLLDVVDLPSPPGDKQYQLWGIVDGKPVDLGVFDLDPTVRLKEIDFVDKVQAFAVTLEPKGGLASPSLDMMYVIGNTL